MIRRRSTRLTQPAGYSHLDWGSPLTSGLAFALSGVDGRDRVSGGAITRTASLSTGVTRHGFGFSSAANAAFSRALDLSGTSEITVSFVLVLRASTTAVLVEYTANYGTNAGSFLIYTDAGSFFAGVSNGAGGAGGFNVVQCTAPALNTPVRVVVTLRRIGTSAKACRIWFDGVEQATTQPNNGAISGNFANSTTYFLGRGASSLFANAIIQDPAIFSRALSDGEVATLSRSPWQLFKPTERRVWVPSSVGGGSVTITGQSVTQATQSTAGAITQTHLLSGATCIQANQSSSAAVTQTHVLAGQSVNQANTCTTGAVGAVTPHTLTGDACSQANGSTAGAVTQVHLLAGAASQQANTSTGGAVSAVPVITLTGAACSQSNTSTSAPVTQTHVLVAAPVAVDHIASASAIVQTHMLAGANCSQVNTSTAGLIRGPVTAPELGAYLSVADALTYLSVAQSTTYLSVAEATRRISVKAAP